MTLLQYWNDRVRRFTIIDLKLAQAAAIFGALILVKLVPSVLSVSIWWFNVLGAACMIRPTYTMFFRH